MVKEVENKYGFEPPLNCLVVPDVESMFNLAWFLCVNVGPQSSKILP